MSALLPVAIPTEAQPGDFLLIPSTRRIRRLYLRNLLDRALIGNKRLPSACFGW